MRKLNKSVGGALPINLLDAKSNKRIDTQLFIMEGKSAMGAVRQFRDPQIHGCYPLKGKFMNVLEKTNSEVIQNTEVQELVKCIGLKLGEDAFDMLEHTNNKIKVILNDGHILVDENDEILINGKWILAKSLIINKPNEHINDLNNKPIKSALF